MEMQALQVTKSTAGAPYGARAKLFEIGHAQLKPVGNVSDDWQL
jgi:hypothetical protein